ncbi:MAG: hypothetical protein HFI75_11165 [Lachnospiraceae bacterium]|nr:hypothetical protein [Lachnospiraceae bacterium]
MNKGTKEAAAMKLWKMVVLVGIGYFIVEPLVSTLYKRRKSKYIHCQENNQAL